MADGGRNPFERPEGPRFEEAEQALIGALLVNNATLDREAVAALEPHHFSVPVHGRIFSAIRSIVMRGRLADAATLRNEFRDDKALQEHGGARYLAELMAASTSISNATQYAVVVREAYIRREMMSAGEQIALMAAERDGGRPLEETLADAVSLLSAVADTGTTVSKATHIATAAYEAVKQVETAKKAGGTVTGISTGLIDLDRATSGLHAPDLIVLAGRPGMGKTALANSIALAAAKAGVPVMFLSLEMSASQLGQRILADLTGVSTERQRAGQVSDDEIRKLVWAQSELEKTPLYIDDTPAASVTQLRMRVRGMVRKQGGCGLVVVDYIQLLVASGKADNRVHELSKITRDLKVLAKEMGVPVLALSQLSRGVESREDKRPLLSDLRESGTIEQDADSVWMLYRHEYYLGMREPRRNEGERDDKYNERFEGWKREMTECEGVAELAIEKNRHGARKTIQLHFDGPRTAFGNLARGGR